MSAVKQRRGGLSRRQFIGGASAIALGPLSSAIRLDAQTPANGASDLGLINGRIHTMDRRQPGRLAGPDPQRPLRCGWQQRRAARRRPQGRWTFSGQHRHPRHHRRAQPHRPRRQPARLAHAARARLHHPRRDRGAEGARGGVPARRVHHHRRPDLGDAVRRAAAAEPDRARRGRPSRLPPGRAGRHADEHRRQGVARSAEA